MKEGGSRKAKIGTDERDEKNDLTRTRSRNPMLARNSPFSDDFALDQAIANELVQLVFACCWSRPNLLSSPHGHELLVFDQRKGRLLVHEGRLRLACGFLLSHELAEAKKGTKEDEARMMVLG